MSNSTELQVLLLLCLLIKLSVSWGECNTNNNLTSQLCSNARCTSITTTNTNKYTLEVECSGFSSDYKLAAEQLTICDEDCDYCIELVRNKTNGRRNDTARGNEMCTLNFTTQATTTNCNPNGMQIQTTALITLCCVLTMLLAMVNTCWICTYCKMKRRIRALEMTPVNYSSTTENSNYKTMLCFQNLSYERNSTSYSQDPPPDGAIYDLPFQTPAGQTKSEKPNDTKAIDRHGSNRYKTAEENMSHAHIVPQIPRANEIEYSGDEPQMVCGVTEYEVPVPLKGTKPSLYDST